jgi:hypothetical protein
MKQCWFVCLICGGILVLLHLSIKLHNPVEVYALSKAALLFLGHVINFTAFGTSFLSSLADTLQHTQEAHPD